MEFFWGVYVTLGSVFVLKSNVMYFFLNIIKIVGKRRKCEIVWILVSSAESQLRTLSDALIGTMLHTLSKNNNQEGMIGFDCFF